MTDRYTVAEEELDRLAAALEFLHPDVGQVLVIATCQPDRVGQRYLATLFLDYQGSVHMSGPIVRKAYELVWIRGWRVRFFRGEPMSLTLSGRSSMLSAHERLEALALFAPG